MLSVPRSLGPLVPILLQINRHRIFTSCYLISIFNVIRNLSFFNVLRNVGSQFHTDVSGLTTSPTLKSRNLLTLEHGTDILSQNISKELPLYAV